ncbi:mitochondrial fission process protein 1 [Anticarsia gemmatalis]|uniref:mitochondrial fission process protein 1 n=1 Tax=Anticarsia gemmatalis TaxID=129554 RepID=UPI003F76D243
MSATGERDFWRDTWVRYLGYANEVGESFRPIVSAKAVRASYAVAFAYTLGDTADKSYKMLQKDGRPKRVLIETGDALIWQTLASVAIPGFVINRICALSHYSLARYTRVTRGARNWITVGIGLISIPFIVHPIDDGTTMIMDNTYRKWLQV